MRRVLIVSPRFAPANAPDMHRVRQSLPYFQDSGWEPVVLAVDPHRCDVPLDPLLERTVPATIRVVRTGVIDRETTRRFGLGNLDVRALPFLARAGGRLLREEAFDLVYFSTTAFAVTALGPFWKRRFGVPFVLDLQDPWVSDYYDRPGAPPPPGGRFKYRLSQLQARMLEPRTLKAAAHVISVSPSYPTMLSERYPWFRPDQSTVLPFGAPESDFELLDHTPVAQRVFDPHDGREHWVYAGAAGQIMAFALRAFFSALQADRAARPARYADLRLHFVGTDYAAGDRARKTVEPIAESCGVGDLVEEYPQRIPYFEALQCLRDADALVVPGSDDPGYTASKLYPYVLARKPLLAIFHAQSSVVDIVRRTRAGVVVPFSEGDTTARVAQQIQEQWLRFDAPPPPETDWQAFEPYTAREMTRQQCRIFDACIDREAEPRSARPG
jgi:hypothetical protein